MNAYRSVRLWQLKSGASARELEELVTSGVLEMQRWIPGVKGLSLIRLGGEPAGRRQYVHIHVADLLAFQAAQTSDYSRRKTARFNRAGACGR